MACAAFSPRLRGHEAGDDGLREGVVPPEKRRRVEGGLVVYARGRPQSRFIFSAGFVI